MSTSKVLYNNCYGGFNLSDAFVEEYTRRTGREPSAEDMFRTGQHSIRMDPVAIAIYEEKGSEWCSGLLSSIRVREIPTTFASYWSIDEYDGDERVVVNVEGALADVLETYIQTGDQAAMLTQYRNIKVAQDQLKKGFFKSVSE